MRALLWVNVFLSRVKYRRLGAEVFAGWADAGFTGGRPTSPNVGRHPEPGPAQTHDRSECRRGPCCDPPRLARFVCRAQARSYNLRDVDVGLHREKAPDSAPTYMGML